MDSHQTNWSIVRLLVAILVIAMFFGLTSTSDAQSTGHLPKPIHYNAGVFQQYYRAEYDDAFKNFKRGFTGAYQRGNRRHLDSICFLTMMGECNYHMGNYAQAISFYEQALGIYLSYQAENWQGRVRVPAGIVADNNAYNNKQITWGIARKNATARVPETFSMLFGRVDAIMAFQTGGAVDNAEIYKVNVTEVMRCTALCLHRRQLIKGPTCKFDPFTNTLVAGLRSNNIANGTVLGAYNGVLLGIAQASTEDYKQAAGVLKRSLQFKKMDHALTPVALLQLARIGGATKNYIQAGQLALQASNAAAAFDQYDLIEESLSTGTTLHLMSSKTPYPPLQNAIVWAKKEKAKLMQASLIQKLAECFGEAGNAADAATAIRQSRSVINNRNSLATSVVGARLKYVGALVRFLNGDFGNGRAELNKAIAHFQTGSLWLYRLSWVESLVANGSLSQREADKLYTVLLRDPTDLDWQTDPFESLAFLASNHVASMERWFNIVIDRKDNKRAIEVAELLRRHRFFSSLPLGGRLMALRWVLHAPEESLTNNAIGQKQAFLARNPKYQQLVSQTKQIETSLSVLPLNPVAKSPEQRQQLKLMKELAGISEIQEAILASFALRREPGEMAFPPQRPINEFQKSIGKDQIALYTMATATGYHLFLLKPNTIQYLDPIDGRVMLRGVGGLLKALGVADSALDIKELQEVNWKESAEELKKAIFGTLEDKDWKSVSELVVIPDGVLWYVPFEALPVSDGADEKYLSDWVHIRYSPTLFLGIGKQRPQREVKKTAVVTARMHPRGEGELSKNQFVEFEKTNPEAVKYERAGQIPSSYLVSILDQLVVWSDVKSTKNVPLAMNPFQIDLNKPGSRLDTWMSLPWSGPKHIVMPGFHTDGGFALRNKMFGQDLFLTSIGMMASGTQGGLLSRWATGGKSAIDLTKQYAEELPKVGAMRAAYNSRQAIREAKLDYENEPRVRTKRTDPVLKAEHPFFWAQHMLFEIPDGRPVVPALAKPDPDDPDAGPAEPNAAPKAALKNANEEEKKAEGENVLPGAEGANKEAEEKDGGKQAPAKPDTGKNT